MIAFSIVWPDTSLRSGRWDERLSCGEENPADSGALVDDRAVVGVLPSDIVDNSINLCNPISGWFFRH